MVRAWRFDGTAPVRCGEAWAPDLRTTLEWNFREGFPQSTLRDLTCAGALCRLSLAHAGAGGHEQLLERLEGPIPWDGAVMLLPADEDGSSTTVYLARPGEDLPLPASAAG